MAIFGTLATVRAQCAGLPHFEPAFAYIADVMRPGAAANLLCALAPGESHRVELVDGMFAIEQVYLTKPRDGALFESHRRYIDIQVVIAGAETMAVTDIGQLTVTMPYNGEKDAALYADLAGASKLFFQAGEAAVFFPADGHMPSLSAGSAPVLVRKTVVKVPV